MYMPRRTAPGQEKVRRGNEHGFFELMRQHLLLYIHGKASSAELPIHALQARWSSTFLCLAHRPVRQLALDGQIVAGQCCQMREKKQGAKFSELCGFLKFS